jgi:hypothetical protein
MANIWQQKREARQLSDLSISADIAFRQPILISYWWAQKIEKRSWPVRVAPHNSSQT